MGPGGEDRRGWVELAVRIAPYFGMKPVRVRWRLENWRRRRAEAARRREQRMDHIRYQHKTCPACGAVQDRDAAICSRCGERLGRRGFQVLHRLGVLAPEWASMSSLLGLVLVLAYARLLAVAPGGIRDLFGFGVPLLFQYGGHWPPAVAEGETWRLLTACFLHAGLLHIGFNMFALTVVGPQVEALYGRLTLLFFFVLTGVLANIGSGMAGLDGVGIGASGGLMGLVGIAAGWGQRQGTTAGRQLRNDMLKWSAYVVLFGFFLRADNWAHVFGLATGFVLGFTLRPETWRRRALAPVRFLAAVLGLGATLAAIALIARPPEGTLRRSAGRDDMGEWAGICRQHEGGDPQGALARARPLLLEDMGEADALEPSGAPGAEILAAICGRFDGMRRSCAALRAPAGDPGLRARCAALERAFGPLPDQPAPAAP